MSTTLVTALYDIGREHLNGKHAHRPFNKYLNWFKHLLWINVPMVVFIPEELRDYVLEHRPSEYETQIIIRNFEELAAYKYHDRMQATINAMNQEPNAPSYFRDCPEFITAKYETIIFSKFDFLKEVSHVNPFNSEYFIWLDAGTFYQPPPFDYKLPWPDPYKIRILKDRFLISDYCFNINDTRPLADKKNYLRLNQNEICAFTLGGTRHAIDRVHTQFWNEVEGALQMGVINNEQHFLQIMAVEHPEYYYCWYRTRYQYPKMPVPLRDRMIPCELARGTIIGENYATNPYVKLLTVATRELAPNNYIRWERTAKHYGYDYEVLGADVRWSGFGTKIRLYLEALKQTPHPYVLLTDCTDVFFTGPSDELYDKYVAMNKELIIGGEMNIYYRGGRHPHHVIIEYFESLKEGPQAYPNSGFIMGRTSEVLKLMEFNLGYNDDQAACIDMMYERKVPMSIDYRTELVGNIPNYNGTNKADIYFEFNSNLNRFKSTVHGTTPCVFHFPGKNMFMFSQFYAMSQPNLTTDMEDTSSAGWITFGIFILVAILIFLIYWWTT